MKNIKFILGFICGAMIFGGIGVFAGQYTATENPFAIQLNGEDITIEGYNINDSTYFKLRDIAGIVGGFNVDFQNNTIQLSKDGYEYDNTVDDTNDIVYYTAEFASYAPDYGYYNGYGISYDFDESNLGAGYYYEYENNQSQIDNYISLVRSWGYTVYYLDSDLTFNGSDTSQVCFKQGTAVITKDDNYIVLDNKSTLLSVYVLGTTTPEQAVGIVQEVVDRYTEDEENKLAEFMQWSIPAGYEAAYSNYSTYNTYASENGLADKK